MPDRPERPSGLFACTVSRCAWDPVIRPGVSANETAVIAVATMVRTSAGRHRREGRCPSGKSRKM